MARYLIAENGESNFCIVNHQYSDETIRYAASELQKYIQKATNAVLPYFSDRCPTRGPEIRLGAFVRGEKLPHRLSAPGCSSRHWVRLRLYLQILQAANRHPLPTVCKPPADPGKPKAIGEQRQKHRKYCGAVRFFQPENLSQRVSPSHRTAAHGVSPGSQHAKAVHISLIL